MSRKNRLQIGKTKKSTDEIISEAVDRQNSWMERRRAFATRFFKKINVFAIKKIGKPIQAKEKIIIKKDDKSDTVDINKKKSILSSYWFPILCAVFVLILILWSVLFSGVASEKIIVIPGVPEPIIKSIATTDKKIQTPSFDIVRIEKGGNVVIAGRYLPNKKISIIMNNKIIATQTTDANGEFVYAPTKAFKPGNYTISLVDVESNLRSENKIFVYVSEKGAENSVSLLMTKDGSTLLQSPTLLNGDLTVSKIDYLAGGRIVVTGNALPRLRVSLSLNDIYLGYAKVSDYKHYGLGADIDELIPGETYTLAIRLHDGDGNVVDEVKHSFVMPKMTGADDTFYTVRRGDCLWIIARNFLKRGVLFSIIAEKNNIKNPNLIFPKQVLKIPVKE